MAPTTRRVRQDKSAKSAKKQKALSRTSDTQTPTAAGNSPFRTSLVQTLLLSIGLLGGLFYGWYVQTPKESNATNFVLPYSHDELVGPVAAYAVVDIPGKGKGAVAIRDIQPGEEILHEKPLFTVPPTIQTSPLKFLRGKLDGVTEQQKQAFFNLSYVHFPKDKDPTQDIDDLALAIFQTNAVKADSEVGIFPRMARLNHGCSRAFNSVYSYRPTEGTLYVHAIKPIVKGEELLTTYTDTKKPRDQRRDYLKSNYGFECTCSVCSLDGVESKASDARLTSMADKWHRFAKWIDGSINGVEAIDLVREIWKLGEEEGYFSERGRLAADAVWVAAGHSDADAVRKWGEASKKWYALELGAGSEQVLFTENIVARPEVHPAWGSREPLVVGGPEPSQTR